MCERRGAFGGLGLKAVSISPENFPLKPQCEQGLNIARNPFHTYRATCREQLQRSPSKVDRHDMAEVMTYILQLPLNADTIPSRGGVACRCSSRSCTAAPWKPSQRLSTLPTGKIQWDNLVQAISDVTCRSAPKRGVHTGAHAQGLESGSRWPYMLPARSSCHQPWWRPVKSMPCTQERSRPRDVCRCVTCA